MFSIYQFEKQLDSLSLRPTQVTHEEKPQLSPVSYYGGLYTEWMSDVAQQAQ